MIQFQALQRYGTGSGADGLLQTTKAIMPARQTQLTRVSSWKGSVIDLSRYVFETLRQDEELEFRRARSGDSELPNILSVAPVSQHPVPGILERLEHEYSLRDVLDSGWAARPLTVSRHKGKPILILKDPGGEPLDRLLGKPIELSQFLRLAAGMAAALSKLHQQGFIHKDIKPANILVNSESGVAWLTGFGIASRLPRERQSAEPPEMIAGTLASVLAHPGDLVNLIEYSEAWLTLGESSERRRRLPHDAFLFRGGDHFRAVNTRYYVYCLGAKYANHLIRSTMTALI
jgi:serine/threonine protein kinase